MCGECWRMCKIRMQQIMVTRDKLTNKQENKHAYKTKTKLYTLYYTDI